ncbi:diaminopimelate epimerase [Pelagibacterium xiamenense]|uniref:diaminopimelate epimerase n=1 Tax=Pelagibacterium xiamenense TaxID=2901140 RepID=UPI001E348DAE|nr:diaminopimelate epimerase [Pelagibacterium xiamenense]MCD7058384.1 diaminopimelate epimerase [Pelagibacterium xiamenense]
MSAPLPYLKMNGLGNDFVVLDARARAIKLTRDQVRAISDRAGGIGCDQLIIMEPDGIEGVDLFMRIYNAEGGEVDACGNATRCIAGFVAGETGDDNVTIRTNAGILATHIQGDLVTADMGTPRFDWDQIPLAEPFADTTGIELQIGPIDAPVLHTPSVVNVGNPHAIFWVDDLAAHDLARFGPLLENHPIFPERANITIAQVMAADRIRVVVWERGAGLTLACGTAACATAVAAARKGLTGRKVTVELPGGPLDIEWRETDGHILMTGPWTLDGEGVIAPELLGETAA